MQLLSVNNMSKASKPTKMGRPAKEPGERKGAVISMRFNDAEYESIKAAASEFTKLSDWARDVLLAKAAKN